MWPVLGLIAALGAGAPASPPAPAASAPAASADAASRGLYVALRVCAACHKVAYPGAGPDSGAPSFAVIHARHDAAELHRILVQISREGHHAMPPIPMSRQEIEDVAAYIAAVAPAPVAAPSGPERRDAVLAGRRIALSAVQPAP